MKIKASEIDWPWWFPGVGLLAFAFWVHAIPRAVRALRSEPTERVEIQQRLDAIEQHVGLAGIDDDELRPSK